VGPDDAVATESAGCCSAEASGVADVAGESEMAGGCELVSGCETADAAGSGWVPTTLLSAGSEADNSTAIAVETPLAPASNIMASASLFILITCRPECEVITLKPGCLMFLPGSACKRSPALQCQSRTTVMTKKRGAAYDAAPLWLFSLADPVTY